MEHGGPGLQLAMPGGTMTMEEVLPGAFARGDLDEVRDDIQEDM